MTELSPHRPGLLSVLPAVHEPQIVLAALTRLRWLAVVGQLIATGVAVGAMHLRLPLTPILTVILLTACSNVLLHVVNRLAARPPAWIVQSVLLLDVLLLTALLYLTGGPQNPFAALYLVHVAISVLVLDMASTWLVVGAVAVCYGLLLQWHRPLTGHESLPIWARTLGSWVALVLVSVLTAAFIGRIMRSLRQREVELTSVRERAVRSEQLAALTTLAAGAAHELNTPLGTIAVVARELELACDRSGDDVMQDDARLIRREVDRCRHILGRMRFDLGEDVSFRGDVNVREMVERLREGVNESDRPRLRLRLAPDIRSVVAPARALEQSLLVLLRNGLDASAPDKPVTLQVSRADGGANVRFEVSDQGTGMSEEMLRRAGQPFYTTKEPGQGMGLGLFLVRLVAEQCGAKFSINSKLGEGTRCVLELAERSDADDGAP